MFTNSVQKPALILKLGNLREKDFFRTGSSLYDGIILTATMLESFYPSVSAFIKGSAKPFVIDPMVYAFSRPPAYVKSSKDGLVKRSFLAISRQYGSLIELTAGQRPITWNELESNIAYVEEVSRRVLEYQVYKVLPPNLFDYYSEFEVYLPQARPEVLVPPYFYFKDVSDPWYQTSLRFATTALEVKEQDWKIFPVLLFSRQLLASDEDIEKMAYDYGSKPFDGYFIWVNDFREDRESVARLKGLASLVRALAESKRPVFKLYGGYFSALLFNLGLSGFSCGLGYGASKNAFAYGGPKGPSKPVYYVPRLHRFLSFEKAEDLLRRHPGFICTCPVCSEVFGNNMDAFHKMRETKHCHRHFLNIRHREMMEISSRGLDVFSSDLESTIQEYERRRLGAVDISNLKSWHSVLSVEGVATGRARYGT